MWPDPRCLVTAFHEAGHTVWLAADETASRVRSVSITPDGATNGRVIPMAWTPDATPDPILEGQYDLARYLACYALAGYAAVAIMAYPDEAQELLPYFYGGGELAAAKAHLRAAYPKPEGPRQRNVDGTLGELWRSLIAYLRQPQRWAQVEAIAAALLEEGELDEPTTLRTMHHAADAIRRVAPGARTNARETHATPVLASAMVASQTRATSSRSYPADARRLLYSEVARPAAGRGAG